MKKAILPGLLVMVLALFLSGLTVPNPQLPTTIKLTVIDYNGNVVEGAAVKMYLTEEDYRNEANQIGETLYTNKKGKVTIKKLEAKAYYLYVTKGDLSNVGGGVRTDVLMAGKVNKLNIVID